MPNIDDPILAQLLSTAQDREERALAARYAPLIRFDNQEPFLPLAAGYTIFHSGGPSPSYAKGRQIELAAEGQPAAHLAIEYAIWWDWDIGHLYELEHVWVFVDQDGRVVRGEASWHGDYNDMRLDGQLNLDGHRLVVYSEPGKHAFAPTPQWFEERWQGRKRTPSGFLAGVGGVLVARYFEGQIAKTPLNDRLVHTHLARHAFEPSWQFDRHFELTLEMLVPWPALRAWIPIRVNGWLYKLAQETPPSSYRFLRIGHRGARAHAPDNTLTSFSRAADLGADMVEMDVQRTADGRVVIVHDAYLTDANGKVWPVQRSTLEELQAIDLGGGERVPTLGEALKVCEQEMMGAYVEIKDGSAIPSLIQVLRDNQWLGHCLLGSFRPDWIAEVKALAPEARTSILFSSIHVDPVQLARSAGAGYVHPCWERFEHPSALLTPEWLARVRQAGLGIILWHEERPAEIAALCQLGVDGICSDAPELLLSPGTGQGPVKGEANVL
jgi:glycerophosphoryl diester phosphodiesterase